MDVNIPWQVVRNESIDNPADTRASEEEKKGPATTHLGNDERHGPTGDLYQGAKEVALVDVALTQVGSVLDVAVVAHEPHHAVKMFTFRKKEKFTEFMTANVYLQDLHVMASHIIKTTHQMTVQRKALRRRFSVLNIWRRVALATGLSESICLSFSSSLAISFSYRV